MATKSPIAKINGTILKWARESSGYELAEISKKLKIKDEKFLEWENGTSFPTMPKLKAIGELFKRPTSIFFLQNIPSEISIPTDYRLHANTLSNSISPKLRIEMRNCLQKREVAIELAEELDQKFQKFSFELQPTNNINFDYLANEAKRFREIFGLSNEVQFDFKDSYGLFNFLRSKIEAMGILVFQSSLGDATEFRGMALYFELVPLIIINTKDSINARIFSLMHEFSHILMRTSGICNLEEDSDLPNQIIEIHCNSFSGNFLVPKEALEEQVRLSGFNQTKTIANKFNVSEEVILRRMTDLNLITREIYLEKRKELIRLYKDNKKDEKNIVMPYTKSLAYNGVLFTSLIMNSLYSEKIDLSHASIYLGLKLKHFGKIEEELSKKILRMA